jgi:hypothetical protein
LCFNNLGLGKRQIRPGFIKLSLRGRLRIQAEIILGSVVGLFGIIKRLVKCSLIFIVNILPDMRIVVVCLRLIQIGLGNDVCGIIILDQCVVFPILLVVQDRLSVDDICLRSGDSQLGGRDSRRRGQFL